MNTFFPHFYHRIIQEIYLIVSILNYMSISTAFFIWFIYLLPGDNLKNTHKPYIFAIACLLSSRFCFLFSSATAIAVCIFPFPTRHKFLCESALWLRVWMKHALHESVQLSWYSHLLILDINKTSGHVSFNLNIDLNLETSMWKHLLELEWSVGGEFTFY